MVIVIVSNLRGPSQFGGKDPCRSRRGEWNHGNIQIKTTVAGRLPGPMEIALCRIVQEALTNVAKHSKASQVSTHIGRKNRRVSCSIEDDGVGFDVRAVQSDGKRRGLGLIAMQERLNGIGGTLSIDSARGRGTRLLMQLPAEASNANSHRAG
jgi:signal transduction histidine kinase